LSTDLTLREAIPQALAGVRLFDPNLADVTIGQLMTHRSGLHSRYHRGLEVLRTFKKENKAWQFSKIAKERLMARPGFAPYHYNNANYLTLGLVIEELTGEPYESYCRNEILDPIGVTTAKLNDTWRVMSAWGGWEMSAADYMRFAQVYFAKGRHFDAAQGIALTAADLEKGRHYGPGVLFAANPTGTTTGTTVWHSGSWRWHGRLADKFGAYFALYDNGFAVSVNYDHDAYKAVVDPALGQIIRRHLDLNLITSKHTDAVFAHLACGMGDNRMAVFELYPECRVGQKLLHDAREF